MLLELSLIHIFKTSKRNVIEKKKGFWFMKNRGKMVTKLCGFVMSASLLMNQAVYASGEIAGETLSGEVQSAEVQEEIMNSSETLPKISQDLSEARCV